MKGMLYGFTLVLLGACGHAPVADLPEKLDSSTLTRTIKLGGRGYIFAGRRLTKGANCKTLTRGIQLQVKSAKGKKLPVRSSCVSIPGYAVAQSEQLLPKGEYEVKASFDRKSGGEGEPKLSVSYADPDFQSGPDQDFGAAAELVENQRLKGTVSYTAGDTSDWVKMKPKGGGVTLSLYDEADSDEQPLTAQIYRLPKGSDSPRLVSQLRNKQRKYISVDPDDQVLARVIAPRYEGEVSYTLVRRDEGAGGKRVKLAVIDCYPITESSSIVLLKAEDGLKADDVVEIFGRKETGSPMRLGRCRVSSVAEGQASCKLDKILPSGVVEYKAEAVLAGGGQS